MNPTSPPETSVGELLGRYEALLLDAYGVLIDSAGARPGGAELLAELARRGTPFAVVTNDASRLPGTAAERLTGFGLQVSEQQVVTSAGLLAEHFAARGLTGASTLVLGPADSVRAVNEAGGRAVPLDGDEPLAALVVADERGVPLPAGLDRAVSRLFRAVDAGRPPALLLPNPDLLYPKGGGEYGITAGSLALVIEAALALRYPDRPELTFTRLGKPGTAIFTAALKRVGTRRAVMIGDQLETDIRGAEAAGLDSALLTSGVTPRQALTATAVAPTWLLPSLELA
jgi:HAD superfamily hydrolase (TIGR01450 family)